MNDNVCPFTAAATYSPAIRDLATLHAHAARSGAQALAVYLERGDGLRHELHHDALAALGIEQSRLAPRPFVICLDLRRDFASQCRAHRIDPHTATIEELLQRRVNTIAPPDFSDYIKQLYERPSFNIA